VPVPLPLPLPETPATARQVLTAVSGRARARARVRGKESLLANSRTRSKSCTLGLRTTTTNESGTYVVSGTTLATTPAAGATGSGDFCVQGNLLHVIDKAMSMSMGAMGQVSVRVNVLAQKQWRATRTEAAATTYASRRRFPTILRRSSSSQLRSERPPYCYAESRHLS
jgi:hypothetical protein